MKKCILNEDKRMIMNYLAICEKIHFSTSLPSNDLRQTTCNCVYF